MKIGGWFNSRERLAKKIAQRNKERIAEYTKISSAFRPEQSSAISENIDSIARYAKRNNCNLEFVPSSKDLGTPKMKVLKREQKFIDTSLYSNNNDNSCILVPIEVFKGEVLLPKNMKTKEEVITAVRTNAAKILYGQK